MVSYIDGAQYIPNRLASFRFHIIFANAMKNDINLEKQQTTTKQRQHLQPELYSIYIHIFFPEMATAYTHLVI